MSDGAHYQSVCFLELITNESVNEELAREFKINSSFRLEDFAYSSETFMEIIFNNLANTEFDGITVCCLAAISDMMMT